VPVVPLAPPVTDDVTSTPVAVRALYVKLPAPSARDLDRRNVACTRGFTCEIQLYGIGPSC